MQELASSIPAAEDRALFASRTIRSLAITLFAAFTLVKMYIRIEANTNGSRSVRATMIEI